MKLESLFVAVQMEFLETFLKSYKNGTFLSLIVSKYTFAPNFLEIYQKLWEQILVAYKTRWKLGHNEKLAFNKGVLSLFPPLYKRT